jgi:hypothetical protein
MAGTIIIPEESTSNKSASCYSFHPSLWISDKGFTCAFTIKIGNYSLAPRMEEQLPFRIAVK